MTGILKVDQWKDSGDNTLMTSDGAGVLTANAGITIPSGATITNNGTASGFGKIGQVLRNNYSTEVTSSSTTFADTGLSLSITPSSTSSKILVLVSQNMVIYDGVSASTLGKIQVLRNSTSLTTTFGVCNRYPATDFSYNQLSMYVLDSPSTTSSITYKTQFAVQAGSEVRVQYGNIAQSYITLMEVLA